VTDEERPGTEDGQGSVDEAVDELPFDIDEANDTDVVDADEATPGEDVAPDDEADEVEPDVAVDGPAVAVDDGTADWESDDDDLTSEDYLRGTTQEYQGLAEEIERASATEWEQQAVAAHLAGVESGLVGFGDVSGTESESEESYEAAEQAASSDLAMRIGSAVVVFGLFLGSLLLGGWWFTLFVVLVMVVSLGEFYATLRTRGYRPLALFGLLGVILMGVGAQMAGPLAVGGWAAGAAVGTILFYSLTPRRNALGNTAVTVLGMAWVGMLAFAILIADGPNPVAHIVFLVLIIASNDIGGYFVGRSFGRRRLAPHVSPNKTVEGFFGGLLLSAVVASVLAVFPPWESIGIGKALVTVGLVGIIAPIGDLAESMVKRDLEVKDMGSVLPGHGGMLDRIDGFLFAVPAVYILFRGFGLL
jgi:phosphatidate cytidylyltransferase